LAKKQAPPHPSYFQSEVLAMMTVFAVIGGLAVAFIVAAIVAGCVMQYYDDDPDWLL
jgi:FlaG/FlaF family flagellin (archaellin)